MLPCFAEDKNLKFVWNSAVKISEKLPRKKLFEKTFFYWNDIWRKLSEISSKNVWKLSEKSFDKKLSKFRNKFYFSQKYEALLLKESFHLLRIAQFKAFL